MNGEDWLRKRMRTRRQAGCVLVPIAMLGLFVAALTQL